MKTWKYAMAATLGLIALVAPRPARADTVYTYTGNNFTSSFGGLSCPPICNLSGSFTIASPLAANLNNQTIIPLAFSFTDGSITESSSDPSVFFSDFTFSTDNAGVINDWGLSIAFVLPTPNMDAAFGSCFDPLNLQPDPTACFVGAQDDISTRDIISPPSRTAQALITNSPGIWTVSTVPEPSSLILLGTGMLGVMGMAARRKLHPPQ